MSENNNIPTYGIPVNRTAAVTLHCQEGYEEAAPEDITIHIRPSDLPVNVERNVYTIRNQVISQVVISDIDWLLSGIQIRTFGDKLTGHYLQIRLQPASTIIFGIDIIIEPNYWAPNGARYYVPLENALAKGLTITLDFRYSNQNWNSSLSHLLKRPESNNSRNQTPINTEV